MPIESQSNPPVLVVDDNPGLRKANGLLLATRFSPILAASGMEGLELFEQHRMRLVVLDRDMPGMNGETVAERMRQISGNLEDPYILMISGRRDDLDINELRKKGVNDYLGKPIIPPQRLIDVLIAANQRFQDS